MRIQCFRNFKQDAHSIKNILLTYFLFFNTERINPFSKTIAVPYFCFYKSGSRKVKFLEECSLKYQKSLCGSVNAFSIRTLVHLKWLMFQGKSQTKTVKTCSSTSPQYRSSQNISLRANILESVLLLFTRIFILAFLVSRNPSEKSL